MHVRDFFTDLPEREAIDAMWGEHAPPDLEAMLVMEIGGRSDMVLAIPLGAAEAARWHAPPTPVSSPLSDRTLDSANSSKVLAQFSQGGKDPNHCLEM